MKFSVAFISVFAILAGVVAAIPAEEAKPQAEATPLDRGDGHDGRDGRDGRGDGRDGRDGRDDPHWRNGRCDDDYVPRHRGRDCVWSGCFSADRRRNDRGDHCCPTDMF